ncbi:MAG: rod shape-determining protein MreD [Veillonella sp.]|nr:rod shape-determining protein MreD [Veillonella sp.]
MGLIAAVVGGSIHDILISNFFGLNLFPYIVVVYLLSLVKSSVYEERWYWSCGIIGVCTILDGIMRCIMISASGGDIQFISYMGHMVMPTVFWNAILGGIGHKLMGLMEEKEDYIW